MKCSSTFQTNFYLEELLSCMRWNVEAAHACYKEKMVIKESVAVETSLKTEVKIRIHVRLTS